MDPENEYFSPFEMMAVLGRISDLLGHGNIREMTESELERKYKNLFEEFQKMFGVPKEKDYGVEDPWIILGVSKDCSREEARKAYRAAAFRYHSDLGGNDKDMVRVNLAYQNICRSKGWQ